MGKGIAILGSTGSIGTQTLEVIADNSQQFTVELLSAHNNKELLVKQAIKYVPNIVIVTNKDNYEFVKVQLQKFPIKVFAGIESVVDAMQLESIDIVLTAMVGYAGLLDLGYAAFFAVGAYTTGILTSQFGINFWLTIKF